MKKVIAPPRYIVQFAVGEMELDARKMVELYEKRKLNFSTMIRPVAGGEFRRFDTETEFLPLLSKLYGCQHILFSTFIYPAIMIGSFAPLLLLPVITPWSWVRILMLFGIPQLLSILVILLKFCRVLSCGNSCEFSEGDKHLLLAIPYWNTFAAWKIIDNSVVELPEKYQRYIKLFNPLFWLSLGFFYSATVWLPCNTSGGLWLWLILVMTLLFAILLSIPFRLVIRTEYFRWQKENPKPPFLRFVQQPKWMCRNYLQYVCSLIHILTALAVWLIPFYATGKIRCAYYENLFANEALLNLRTHDYITNGAFEEIFAVQLPDPTAESTADEAEKLRPQLAQFRSILRKHEHFGINFKNDNQQDFDRNWKLLHNYLYWSRLLPDGDPRELLLDLTRCMNYEKRENPNYATFRGAVYAHWRKRILEKHLSRLSDTDLANEKEFLSQELATWQQQAKEAIFIEGKNGFSEIQYWTLFPFRDNIRASLLRYLYAQLEMIKQETYVASNIRREEESLSSLISIERFFNINVVSFYRTLAFNRLSLSAVELEQYRRKRRAFPDEPHLPPDPFSGNTLRYMKGKKIYSIGQDGIDDGGRDKTNGNEKTFDIVFNLES